MGLKTAEFLAQPSIHRYISEPRSVLKKNGPKVVHKNWREEAAIEAWASAKKITRSISPSRIPRAPIRAGNFEVRFSDWENEERVAAYLNFSDKAAFRHFLLSFPILNAYIAWHEHSERLPRTQQVFVLLNNNDIINSLPNSLEGIVKELGRKEQAKSPEAKATSKESSIRREDLLLAAILVHLVKYTSPFLERFTLRHRLEMQSSASTRFEEVIGLKIHDLHDVDQADVTYWGKRMWVIESPIETYNRAFVLLNHLHYLVSHKWDVHWGSSDAFASQKIPFEAYPAWMKRTDGDASHLLWR